MSEIIGMRNAAYVWVHGYLCAIGSEQVSRFPWSGVGVLGASHYGAERQEIGKARAQRLVQEGLLALG